MSYNTKISHRDQILTYRATAQGQPITRVWDENMTPILDDMIETGNTFERTVNAALSDYYATGSPNEGLTDGELS